MRLRTVFIVLLIVVLLIGLGPALLAVGSQEVAEALGCQVDLNRVIPCVIGGKDYGQTFYDLGFSIWYSYLSIPVGLALLGVWAVAALIAFLVIRRRQSDRHPSHSARANPFSAARSLSLRSHFLRSPSPILPASSPCFLDAILTKRPCIPAYCSASISARCCTQWGSRSGSFR
jgi:hypothetical protein